ncbi:MAG: hypothetical protein M3332_17155 [Actinomycetota bacterium]|nr:hypothetical protein [Actinomycetota bacterium]
MRRGLTVQHGLKRRGADVRAGHPRVGELSDVGGDSMELREGALPGRRARTTGRDQRAVNVEEQDPVHGIHFTRLLGAVGHRVVHGWTSVFGGPVLLDCVDVCGAATLARRGRGAPLRLPRTGPTSGPRAGDRTG